MADVEKLLCSISFCAEALQDTNSQVWAGLSRAKLGLAGCLQLFLSTVWRGLYPMHGERLERSCSCASNCAHLHSPHHPPRCPENRRTREWSMGARGRVWTDGKAKRGNWKGGRTGPRSTATLTVCRTAPLACLCFKHSAAH